VLEKIRYIGGMINLSVNINKVALIRNSRGRNVPNVLQVAKDCVAFGADGITVHPRPDGRHIRKEDVYILRKELEVEFNVEGYPSTEFLQMMEAVRPAQCTLVPDPPGALTSEAGWDTYTHKHFLLEVIQQLQSYGIRTSIFIETDLDAIGIAQEIGTDRIELYTEAYASEFPTNAEKAIEPYVRAAGFAHELGLGINAGHDLNLANLTFFAQKIPHLEEVSIGHALISDALYKGLSQTIHAYKACFNPFTTG